MQPFTVHTAIAAPLLTCGGAGFRTLTWWGRTSLPPKLVPTATTVRGLPARCA